MIQYRQRILLVFTIGLSFFSSGLHAQSTPTEFAEMSLQELIKIDVDAEEKQEAQRRLVLSYQFKMVEFEGYLDGDSALSNDDVLWAGAGETRNEKNFPVLPTVIDQQAHIFSAGYRVRENFRMNLQIPYLRQATDHISIVRGYDAFLIETQGLGDVVISASQRLNQDGRPLWMSLGISVPTGSIDEKGDTPRAPGDQFLPYTMQLGSGTYDLPFEFHYHAVNRSGWDAALGGTLRFGENKRNYRLGNTFKFSLSHHQKLLEKLTWSMGGLYSYSERIHGQDDRLTVNAAFPFPASITNPALFGGEKINVELGLAYSIKDLFLVQFDIEKPLYQNLNGPQPKEQWRSSMYLSRVF